jgi:fluoroacetyl-CoA thioesterase
VPVLPASIGESADATITVSALDTAITFRSGDLDVLSTPRLVALLEEATIAVIESSLQPAQTSVGVRVEIDHLGPAHIGEVVTAHATLEGIGGHTLTFAVSAQVGDRVIGKGRIVRVIVERSRFDVGRA